MRPRLSPLVASALLLLGATAWPPARGVALASEGSSAFEFRSGVLVDVGRGVCYLMNSSGGIDALDLRSGKALWTTSLAQKPLLLLGHTLVAQAKPRAQGNVLRVVLLDTEKSGASRAQADIDLPDGVRATVDDGAGTAFRVRAWAGPSGLFLSWTYVEQTIRGMMDSLRVQSPERQLQGVARMDLETGRISPAGEIPEVPAPPLPAKLAQFKEDVGLPGPLWRTGDIYATAAKLREDGTERTVLKRWRATTGDPLPDVTLFMETLDSF